MSKREHLEQVAKQTGRDDILAGPPIPDCASHVWELFLELHKGRTYGMSGPNPLSYGDIAAWCNLTGIALSSWEVGVIKTLDMAWMKAMNED